MTIEVTQKAFQPRLDEGILDVLGYAAPSFLLSYMQLTTDAVLVLSDVGEVRYANARALDQFFGTELDAIRGELWLRYVPQRHVPRLDHAMALACNGRAVECRLPQDLLPNVALKDELAEQGETGELQLSLSPIFMQDSALECLLAVLRTIPVTASAQPLESG